MTENNINENNAAELENEGQQEKTYTEDEVRELLQRETDRRVSSALKKQEKDYQKKISLAQLDERERANAEKDMRIAELQEKLASYEIEKNRSELKSILSSRGLSAEFADLIQITDDMRASSALIHLTNCSRLLLLMRLRNALLPISLLQARQMRRCPEIHSTRCLWLKETSSL